MHNLRVRLAIVLALLAVVATVSAVALYPTRRERSSLKAALLPMELGDWVGREIPVDAETKAILETDDGVMRFYVDTGERRREVQFAVVFSPQNRRVAHPPEICYKGAGWETSEKKISRPDGLPPLVRLIVAKGLRRDMVIYCYKAGDKLEANYYRQQINIIANQLAMRSTSSALIRLSAAIQLDEERTEKDILDFARLMIPEIQEKLAD